MVLESLRPTTSGGRPPACAIRSFDNAKVRNISCASKFRPSIWTDFQHKITQFQRTVTSRPRIRNTRGSCITFRRWRARCVPRPTVPSSHRPIKVVRTRESANINGYNNIIIIKVYSHYFRIWKMLNGTVGRWDMGRFSGCCIKNV